jgi:hypothetical protein
MDNEEAENNSPSGRKVEELESKENKPENE